MTIQEIADQAVPPSGTRGAAIIPVSTPSGRLPNGDPDGRGVKTSWTVKWFDGLRCTDTVAEKLGLREALALHSLITGRGSEIARRREARREAVERIEATEAAADAETGNDRPQQKKRRSARLASRGRR